MNKLTPELFEEIVDSVYEGMKHSPNLGDFKNMQEKELIQLHHGWGTHIRNTYNLWQLEWEPEIDDDWTDMSPAHPDAISQRIIEIVWKRFQDGESE